MINPDFEKRLAGKTVLVTGHTGFTGSWACLWLKAAGARVIGFSLPPPTAPSLFEAAGIAADVEDGRGDIRDYAAVEAAIREGKPDLILHLAAQPLVRRAYRQPLDTFAVNAMGTANVLEAARQVGGVRGVVCVTTDKVYENREWSWPYRENDRIGGRDPYSASKAAAEMIIDGYRHSFPSGKDGMPAIATARGGNIVGGGDWAEDRLIPDFIRAATGGDTLHIRHPDAIRPWQHVLALVQGYLMLLSRLADGDAGAARAWNFGPADDRAWTVRSILEILSGIWPGVKVEYGCESPVHESSVLTLDSSLARRELDWRPLWKTERVLVETVRWYRVHHSAPEKARDLALEQLSAWREGVSP